MGLAELLLGKSNPITQFVNENQNKIRGAFAGFGAEPGFNQSLSNAALGAAQGAPLDQVAAEKRQQEEQARVVRNQTAEWLRSQPGGQQFADALDKGMIDGSTAFKSWIDASKGQQPIEINGQLVDPKTFEVLGDFRTPETNAGPAPPAGYRWNAEGGLEFIPGGPHDPANAASKPPTDADVRAAKLSGVIQGDKELLLGPNGIYDKLADPWSQAVGAEVGVGGIGVGRPGLALTAPDYQSATNALTNIAQSYLYAISGQAAPAGEVAKIIESVTPKFGEDASSVKNKKARLASYIAAIEASKYDVPTSGGAGGGDAEIEGILTGLGI